MTSWVIELNAAEVRLGQEGEILLRSPGYAVVHGDKIWLGEEARRQAYLYPHRTYDRFWSHLSQETLRTSSRRFRHHADLAYAHLLALYEQAGQPKEIVFAVPGHFSPQQLSLLLGIAKACPFAAVGLVDSAVAGAATVVGCGRYWHLDMDLYHTVLTELEVGTEIVRCSVETLDNVGLSSLYEASAELVADTFIQQSRFDPRHQGESEQAVHDALPHCLASQRREMRLEIQCQRKRYQAKLSREALLEVLQPYYRKVWQRLAPQQRLLLSDRMAALPGFTAGLSHYACLVPEAVFSSCHAHRGAIRSPGPDLKFVTRLPLARRSLSQAAAVTGAQKPAPALPEGEGEAGTHLLWGHHAFPLRECPLYLSAAGGISTILQASSSCAIALNSRQAVVRPLGERTVYVNGEPLVREKALGAGDKIGFAGSETVYFLIRLAHPDAS